MAKYFGNRTTHKGSEIGVGEKDNSIDSYRNSAEVEATSLVGRLPLLCDCEAWNTPNFKLFIILSDQPNSLQH